MVRRTKQEAEKTRHELLDAAIVLFLRQGIANTTLKDIADKAGKTRGAIYWHFDNKDAVIQALWERNADTFYQAFSNLVAQSTPPDAALKFRQEIKNILHSVLGDEEYGQVIRIIIHNVEFTDEQTELQLFLTSKKDDFVRALESSFRALEKHKALKVTLEPELLAQGLFSYIHGLIYNHLKPGNDSLDLNEHGDTLIDLLLDSVLEGNWT